MLIVKFVFYFMVLGKLFAHSYIHTCIHTYVHFEGIASCIFLFDLHSLSRSTWRCHMVFSGKTTCSYSHAKVVYLYFNYFVYITTRICRVFGHQQNFWNVIYKQKMCASSVMISRSGNAEQMARKCGEPALCLPFFLPSFLFSPFLP